MTYKTKKIYVISGGTLVHIRPHFSLCAPAYGSVGAEIYGRLSNAGLLGYSVIPIFTRMASSQAKRVGDRHLVASRDTLNAAGLKYVETNDDLQKLVDYLKTLDDTRCIIMAAAVCDWEPDSLNETRVGKSIASGQVVDCEIVGSPSGGSYVGKDSPRLQTRGVKYLTLHMTPADKIIGGIRAGEDGRKDIFLVSFKATAGVTPEETYAAGLRGLKGSSSNLVFANDVQTGTNVVVTPEEFPYYNNDRDAALDELCEMIEGRLKLTFTRTLVQSGDRADIRALHEKGAIPLNFLPVLEWLIEKGAYKTLPWKDSTSGHFGCIVEGEDFSRISSVRKANHNKCLEEGVAKILGKTEGGKIIAVGARPSVGEHTQEQIYAEINDASPVNPMPEPGEMVHNIVHFHCPTEARGLWKFDLSHRPQKQYECGSDQCGINTATGMKMCDTGIWAVHLEGHGPNIAFHRDVPAERIIKFIEQHWDLNQKSGGNVVEVR